MQYKVVTAHQQFMYDAIRELEKEVNKLIRDGWKPVGGVSITQDQYFRAAQAMGKE